MIKTYSSSLGVTVKYAEPVLQGTSEIDTITQQLTSYSHEVATFGGYDRARLNFSASRSTVEDWLEYGLGRRIVTYDEAGVVIWEGFVNSLTARLGGLNYTVGPLLEIANYVRVAYSIPFGGSQSIGTSTDWAIDQESVDKYGRFERVLSGGTVGDSEADQIRDTYLEEHSKPESNRDMSFDNGGGDLSLSLDCLGYVHWLGTYKYNQTASEIPITRDAMIALVLSADPNAVIDSSTAGLESNATLVSPYRDNNAKAIDVIKGVVAGGDASFNRWQFGIYADRKAYYAPVSTEIDYYQYLGSPAQSFTNPAGQVVKPWQLQPGRWLFFPDFLVGRVEQGTDLADDPRALFIESLTFTAPYQVSITGSKYSKLDQKVARLGLSGVSA